MTKAKHTKYKQKHTYTVYTLGRFDVIKDNDSLITSTSTSKKIWELYKFMLTHRDRSFTPEALMDQLWIYEEYNDPRSTLRRQMHRLRQTLHEDGKMDDETTVLYTNGYYKWNDQIELILDADHFEMQIQQGDASIDSNPDLALESYLQAIDLYLGDYLPECADQHWVFPIRNQYRRRFIKAIYSAIKILKAQDNYDTIIRISQKAIKMDIYEESFHLNLMDALLVIGEQRQAFDHYIYINAFYDREMGIQPSDEMKAIYKKLLQTQQTLYTEDDLMKVLESNHLIENAFYCEPDVFKSIYELERRRSERSGKDFSIGVLTLQFSNKDTLAQRDHRIRLLKELLMSQLRKGDTFTQWNEQQMIILLPGVDEVLTEKILKRVVSKVPLAPTVSVHHIDSLKVDLSITPSL
ncbi:BTAD domain-containing putative transcriptional regulator [Petrocella sp. FN5]|uniref:BTAD domain-containing putative transcriptional regulator n=1 Tax=Petrocella sp. FN5 TaxID=3032002 RepID=UPI0023D9E053|nr:BTAD domain-containing putative transcriptional regulator [Petrocella sp. FN5]MDF1616625.1 BTAD domain-containing putative transcriptional regulator [Petrocella sp. FN5]